VDGVNQCGKPYILSLSGLSLGDNLLMLTTAMGVPGIAAIELNLACPNIPGKPVIAYDFEQMEDVLQQVVSHPLFKEKPLGVKLAPYFDVQYFQRVTTILAKYPIRYVVTTNTIGNSLFIDYENECQAIAPGFGGLGGKSRLPKQRITAQSNDLLYLRLNYQGGYVKQVALSNVRFLYNLLKEKGREDIDIVGVGGVSTGRDAFELILCGARAVQVGTCHWTEGPGCFDRIANELEEIMRRKGYAGIEDFRGKLKPFVKGAKISSLASKTVAQKDASSPTTLVYALVSIIVVLVAILVAKEVKVL
jgi:dihydroorotate dehydrogenase (fumarate)